MSDNITLLLSCDNYVYGLLTCALEEYPFNIFKGLVVETTYLYGIKTLKIFAISKDIEDIITLTTNCEFKPLLFKDSTSGNTITTKHEICTTNMHCYINISTISMTTQYILEKYKDRLKQNIEDDFISFCAECVNDYETSQFIYKTVESIQDADMMIQCSDMMNELVHNIFVD